MKDADSKVVATLLDKFILKGNEEVEQLIDLLKEALHKQIPSIGILRMIIDKLKKHHPLIDLSEVLNYSLFRQANNQFTGIETIEFLLDQGADVNYISNRLSVLENSIRTLRECTEIAQKKRFEKRIVLLHHRSGDRNCPKRVLIITY